MFRLLTLTFVCTPSALLAADPARVTFDEADARLRSAFALAQETNDTNLVTRVLELRDAVRKAFTRKDIAGAERLIRDAEAAVGLDAGGRTMLGLPVGRINPTKRKAIDAHQDRLAAAMRSGDRESATTIAGEIGKLLGDDAGVPDVRRRGDDNKPHTAKPADVADAFLKLIEADPRALKALSAGVPGPETLPRTYAAIVHGCLILRPVVEQHRKDKLEVLDALVRGCSTAMLALQLKQGSFKFPDLRGKHLRYGEIIEKLVELDPEAVRGDWVVLSDPAGELLVDGAECGIALLLAGAAYKNVDWTKAGRLAADWAVRQNCVPLFHHNAVLVSLLCEAFRMTGEAKYLKAAQSKYEIGIRPGQLPGGRWINPTDARTAWHLMLIRSLHDLEGALPAGKERDGVADCARRAMKSLLDEADKLGAPVTALTIQELARHFTLHADADARVRVVVAQSAAGTMQRAASTGRSRTTVAIPELAAVARIPGK